MLKSFRLQVVSFPKRKCQALRIPYTFLGKNKKKNWIKLAEFNLLAIAIIVFLLKFILISRISINQDEFYFLSNVYLFKKGKLFTQFQTFYVHFFTWISNVSKNEVTQIIFARFVMYVLFLISCYLIFLIGKHFLNNSGSLFGMLCYISFSYIIINGSSFRADSLITILFLLSILFVIKRNHDILLAGIAGIVIAISLMISLKSLFHLLTVGVVLLIANNRKTDINIYYKKILSFGMGLIIGFFILYVYHISTLPFKQLANSTQYINHVSEKAINFKKLFPQIEIIVLSVKMNFIIWALFIIGFIFYAWDFFYKRKVKQEEYCKLVLLAFLIPLLSLIFYRNSYPYYYICIMAPAIIYCGVGIHKITEHLRHTSSKSRILKTLCVSLYFLIFIHFLFYYTIFSENRIVSQIELIETVHKIFPEPVEYIDGCSMISSFPSVGFFMSSWRMESYTSNSKPIMKDIINSHKPKFILANVPQLNISLTWKEVNKLTNLPLLKEDWEIIKDNYIHHWGIIYVPGKKIEFNSINSCRDFEILIPGVYTYEGEQQAYIDGNIIEPNCTIRLEKGIHSAFVNRNNGKIILRWGENLYKPANAPSLIPIFIGPFL